MGYVIYSDKKVPTSANAKALAGFKAEQANLFSDGTPGPAQAQSDFNAGPKVSRIKRGGTGEPVLDYIAIQQLLTHKDPEATARSIRRDVSHVHLVVKQALRTIATRCGYTVATDYYANYMDHASWWLTIVNSFIEENHLYKGGDKIQLIDALIRALPVNRQKEFTGQLVKKVFNIDLKDYGINNISK